MFSLTNLKLSLRSILIYRHLLEGLFIHKIIEIAVVIEILHILALNISGGEFVGGVEGALGDRIR
jgi:hypothetical protein